MTRAELIQILVLNDVADDYENLEHVTAEVARIASTSGLQIDNAEVGKELSNLIASGLVKAYRLSPSPVEEVPSVTAIANLQSYYYWQTPKGKEVHRNADWPLDDEGRLLYKIEDAA